MLSRLFKIVLIFVVFVFAMKRCGSFRGCNALSIINNKSISGNGKIIKQTRDVGAFTKISLENSADVEIVQGTTPSVVVETDENLIDKIETVVENGKLRIRQKENNGNGFSFTWSNDSKLKVYVTNPTFTEIEVKGSGNVEAKNKITSTDLSVTVTGSGNAEFSDLEAPKANMEVTGSGNIKVEKGNTDNLELSVVGSGDADLINLAAKSVNASVTGSGNLKCNASEKYDLRVSGSGDIKYKKTSASMSSKTSGSGNIEPE